MTVVTFEAYLPSPRYDGVHWAKAVIEEAPASAGPWTQIDQIIFADPDADPTDPKSRNLTTDNATLQAGWYRVTFVDQFGGSAQPTAPVYNGPSQMYEPTVDQVARKVMSRTVDMYGNYIGTFNTATMPTDSQVQQIIGDILPEIADVIGDVVPEAMIDDAAEVASIRAAMQVELDFFSDQVNTGRSIYPQLKELYESSLANLQTAVIASEEGDGTVTAQGPGRSPSYSFPLPMTKLDQRW